MRAALFVAAIAALGAGLAAAGSDIFNRSQRAAAPTEQIGAWTDARTSIAEYKATSDTLATARRESDLVRFVGYSRNGAGETFAQFYDELSQTVFALDRKAIDERAKNLREQGISADETERVSRHWPMRDHVEF